MRAVATALGLALLAGCGGGSGHAEGPHGAAAALAAADATRPTVGTLSPANGATNVVTNRVVSITFSEPMNCTTLNGTTFKLKNSAGTTVGATVKCSGSTATLTPTPLLAAGKKYTATVSTGARDLAGNALAAGKSWSFTVSAAGTKDSVRPFVTTVVPADRGVNVSLLPTITGNFSEALDCATVNNTTFRLKNAGGANVPGIVSCSGKQVRLTPKALLAGSAAYTATLTTGVRDQARNPLAAAKSWSFTTRALPSLSISDAVVVEGASLLNGGTGTALVFTVSISAASPVPVTVGYATANGTAVAGTECDHAGATYDYVGATGTVTIPPGQKTSTISVTVCGDSEVEMGDETLLLTLSDVSAGATLATATAVGTIVGDDLTALNDTGVTKLYDDTSEVLSLTDAYAGQDGFTGRDTGNSTMSAADGWYGLSFTKLDATGKPLADQSQAYDGGGSVGAGTWWACVLDNVTGLVWEVKTVDGGLRDTAHTYYTEGDDPTDTCGIATGCHVDDYAAALNEAALCGYSDWRLPTREELRSIAYYQNVGDNPQLDVGFLPTTQKSWYWSADDKAGAAGEAWGINFGNYAMPVSYGKITNGYVLLVRGGTTPPARHTVALETVRDNATGLTWKRCAEGFEINGQGTPELADDSCDPTGGDTSFTWQDALALAEAASFAGQNDWRVPNIKELSSIVDTACSAPAIDGSAFPNASSAGFWTSTTHPNILDWGLTVAFSDGGTYISGKTNPGRVRLVRGGP